MKTSTTIIIILTLVILALIFFLIPTMIITPLTGRAINSEKNLNTYTYTKAICNSSNYCQDNEITCQDNQVISITPLTGAVVQFDSNWKDPRDEETKEKLC